MGLARAFLEEVFSSRFGIYFRSYVRPGGIVPVRIQGLVRFYVPDVVQALRNGERKWGTPGIFGEFDFGPGCSGLGAATPGGARGLACPGLCQAAPAELVQRGSRLLGDRGWLRGKGRMGRTGRMGRMAGGRVLLHNAYPQKRLTVRGKALRSAHEVMEFCLAIVLVEWLSAEA
jgi:hypothetical protein